MKKTHLNVLIISLLMILWTGHSIGHDFWLEAHPFYTENNQTVELSVHVGNDYAGDSLPNITQWYSDFSRYQSNNKTDIAGELGRDPAGYFTPKKTGTHLIGYQSIWHFAHIDSDTFNKYLLEEGLINAINDREANQQTDQAGKENYIRHAKALVQVGNQWEVDDSTHPIGYELEIIPLRNPYKSSINDLLTIKILFRGKPVQGLQLMAFNRNTPKAIQKSLSNKEGEVTIKLNQPGDWLLKTVKIYRIYDDEADWQSHLASMTFSLQ